MELSREELLFADLILSKLILNQQRSIFGMFPSILDGLGDTYSPLVFQELHQISSNSKRNRKIIDFLLEQDYINPVNNIPYHALTEKGQKAKELGGHANFIKWKSKEDKKQKRINWPQKNWIWVALGSFAIGWIGDLTKDLIIMNYQKQTNTDKTKADTVIKYIPDTVRIHYPPLSGVNPPVDDRGPVSVKQSHPINNLGKHPILVRKH